MSVTAKINILPKETAQLIAAGEVVERPASVVKELMENSIDAGAKRITVEIKNGGVRYIRITDDGCGIDREDVRAAFISHATSKISCAPDLDSITTLGFRGEALASVAAVAEVEMLTRSSAEPSGTRYVITGGEEQSLADAGCPVGTTVMIRDLFFNTPARMKFLKKDSTEAGYVYDVLSKTALSHPEISVTFIKDNKRAFFTPGDGRLKTAISAVLGNEAAGELIEVCREGDISVHGYITRPVFARANRTMQHYFVNGRYVKLPSACSALDNAYKNRIAAGKFPACVLFLEADPRTVDVNVHPAKTQVRFANEKAVYDAVYFAALTALEQGDSITSVGLSAKTGGAPFQKTGLGSNHASAAQSVALRRLAREAGEDAARLYSQTLKDKAQPSAGGDLTSDGEKNAYSGGESKARSGASALTLSDVMPSFYSLDDEDDGELLFPEREEPPRKRCDMPYNLKGDRYGKKRRSSEQSAGSGAAQGETQTPRQDFEYSAFAGRTAELTSEVKSEGSKTAELTSEVKSEDSQTAELTSEVKSEDSQTAELARELESEGGSESPVLAAFSDAPRIIGEVFSTYILAELKGKLIFVDKHAAHERIIYNSLKEKKLTSGSQLLLAPVTVSLSRRDYVAVTDNLQLFADSGWSVSDFGEGTVIVRECPSELSGEDVEGIIEEMADKLAQGASRPRSEKLDWLYYSTACRAAIKAGDSISVREMEELVERVLSDESVRYCPHGRPVIFTLSEYELEKLFGRSG